MLLFSLSCADPGKSPDKVKADQQTAELKKLDEQAARIAASQREIEKKIQDNK